MIEESESDERKYSKISVIMWNEMKIININRNMKEMKYQEEMTSYRGKQCENNESEEEENSIEEKEEKAKWENIEEKSKKKKAEEYHRRKWNEMWKYEMKKKMK